MSRFINIDSERRTYAQYSNPCDFIFGASQFDNASDYARTVNNLNPPRTNENFVQSVRLHQLIVPFFEITYGTTTSHFADLPFILVDIHSSRYNDSDLVTSADNTPSGIKFVCKRKKIITNQGSTNTWIEFECDMVQVMRIQLKGDITFKLKEPDGAVINLSATEGDITKRVQALFEVTPHERDGKFDNQKYGQRVI